MKNSLSDQTFYLSLIRLLLHAKQEIVTSSAELGLSSMQAFTLLLADNQQPRSMTSLCRLFACDPSNVTGIIDGLAQKGLVSRQEDPHDRRVKMIHLEPAGQVLKEKVIKQLSKANIFPYEALNQVEAAQFSATIEKLATYQST